MILIKKIALLVVISTSTFTYSYDSTPVTTKPLKNLAIEKEKHDQDQSNSAYKNSLLNQLILEQKYRNIDSSDQSSPINIILNRNKEITPKNPLNELVLPFFSSK